ncbi:MAG: TetR/AcrR family transcriptional regulator, partial [Gemmatimonadaceae bacterium]
GVKRLPRADRERQALEAARTLFAARGFAAVTMDEVAAAIGVTKPLLYTYFGNKEQLFLACMTPAGDALVETVARALAPAGSPAAALRAGVHAFFAFVDADRRAWRVLFDETLHASGVLDARAAQQRERLTALIAANQLARLPAERREAARAEIEGLSAALLAAAEALARWWLGTEAMPAAEAAELLVRTVEPGLRTAARV